MKTDTCKGKGKGCSKGFIWGKKECHLPDHSVCMFQKSRIKKGK